ncbi:putative D-aminoacylase [Mollisia scopiformis]|uniref:Putative D-aminoacylase n=1 Tax=Mollisia scopiformis TaxID=149040 RepID=A0A194WWM7_MOLSC|nr:putative D-aminoacylase [Mollisia scopiformis]KUJ12381.1 putative D-aminoacylase [Mollisia scopiformis]
MATNDETTRIRSQIEAQESLISSICRIGGAPSLSLGVIHGGKEIYSNHFGHRDIQAGEASDGNTTYFVGSITKAMVSALTGIYVEKALLDWTTPVSHILPELVGKMDGRGGIDTWSAQPLVRDFRTDYLYNNFGYEITCRVIEKVTGKTLGTNLKEQIYEPLGMSRTSLNEAFPSDSNFAKAYFALDDGSPFEFPIPTISDKTFMSGAGSVRSCTNDMMLFYKNFMHATNDHCLTFFDRTTNLPPISLREQSCALGWARAELPGTLGVFNYNKYLVPAMPVIGQAAASRLVVYHGGSMQGFTSAVYLLPETETAIFALQNLTGLCDPCDWMPQLLIETIFGAPNIRVDFEHLAKIAAKTGAGLADRIQSQLEQALKSFYISVFIQEDGGLYMCFQDVQNETYRLRHYHYDVFIWNESHNETAKRGRFQTRPVVSYEIGFESAGQTEDGRIDRLRWIFDETHPTPGTFIRETDVHGRI